MDTRSEGTAPAEPSTGRRRAPRSWEAGLFWVLVAGIVAAVLLVLTGAVRAYGGELNGSGLFMLSAFLQSLAAVLGIAFTLTLIGIQLAAQTYTHRVIGLHTRSVVFVLTFGMFLGGMVFLAGLLSSYRSLPAGGHPWMDLAVVWFVSALALLVPFALRTIRLLAPGDIAAALLARLGAWQLGSGDTAAVHVRIGPVFDMARKAIVGRDERTLELLMAQVQLRVEVLLDDRSLGPDGLARLVRAVGPEFRDLGWLATDRSDIGAVKQVVDALRQLVCRAAERPDHQAAAEGLYSAIRDIWKEAEVRFSDKAYAARLADLDASMNACRLEITGVLRHD
jgi:hypothetical protein